MQIRFAGTGTAVPLPALPAPAAKKKGYANREILQPLSRLAQNNGIINRELIVEFAKAWSANPHGAITTMGRVIEETVKNLLGKQPVTVSRREAANRLNHSFLGFFRREFWDTRSVASILKEFRSLINPRKRSEETRHNALAKGLPERYGAWREFFSLIQKHAQPEFEAAIATINKEIPEPPQRVIILPPQ